MSVTCPSQTRSWCRTSTLLGTCSETCRWETCSNAVRPAACVQVLNCIDYLYKFGYSKEQVGACPQQLSGARRIV